LLTLPPEGIFLLDYQFRMKSIWLKVSIENAFEKFQEAKGKRKEKQGNSYLNQPT